MSENGETESGIGESVDALSMMLDLEAPQERYREAMLAGGFFESDGLVMSYDPTNTRHVLRTAETFSSVGDMGLGNVRPMIPLNIDPPDHAKYRKLLDPLFAPRVMERQEADLVRRAGALIDGFVNEGECNYTEQYAEVYPSLVFLSLLGLPEDQLDMFLKLRDGILHPEKVDPAALPFTTRLDEVRAETGQQMYDYFGELVDRRQVERSDDIISLFLDAEIKGADGPETLSRNDILDIMFLFMIAGLDTVSDSLTCFFAFLARNPSYQQQLVDNPQLIPSAVEELLRWESPVPTVFPRMTTEDAVLPGGQEVKAGCPVMVNIGAANLDPETFEDPFDVQFDRAKNPHLSFGAGVHRCLGSHLARRELRISLAEWHKRIPSYRLKPGHEELEYPPGLRHVKDLTLSWD